MYILPNKKEIDDEEIIAAMQDDDDGHHYFLDSETGKVEAAGDDYEEDEEHLEMMEKQTERYFPISPIPSYEKYKWMESFVYDFVGEEDENLKEKLEIALDGKGAFRRFKDVLYDAGEGWIEGWYEWESCYFFEEMKSWLFALPIEIKEEPELFDDCPICQAMKEGKTSLEDMKEAFQKAKEAAGVTFEEDK